MSEENKKRSEYNIFIAKSIYPEAASVFTTRFKPLEEIKGECYIVLDTNVLFAPYTIGETDLLDQCRRIYSSLIRQGRLIIPGQVAREFAKNRAGRLAELYQRLSRRRQQVQQIQSEKYPLLGSLQDYKEIIRLESEINTKIQEYQKAIGDVLNYIQGWQWDDPVSLLYSELFTDGIIVEPSLTEEEIGKDLDTRQLHSIPPGYKDATKEDRGVGDLIIWHTILELGRKEKNPIIFVSGEEKADWFQKSEKLPLYPRYELVDEFRRASEGQSFYIIRFSRFLELFGASEEVVEEVRQEEKLEVATRGLYGYRLEEAVLRWIQERFSGSRVILNPPQDAGVDVTVQDQNGFIRGIIIFPLLPGRIFTANLITSYSSYLQIAHLNELLIVIVVNEEGVQSTIELLKSHSSKEANVHYLVGFVNEHGQFIDVRYI